MVRLTKSISANLYRLVAVRHQLIFSQSLGALDVPDQPLPSIEPFTFRFPVDREALDTLIFEGGDRERAAIRRYLATGEQLAVMSVGNIVACRGLVRHAGYVSLEGDRRFRKLLPGELFIHYCRTADGYRGRRLYPAMLTRILDYLRRGNEGSRAVISCRHDNIPSIKGIEKAKFGLVQRTFTLGVLGGRVAYTFSRASRAGESRTNI